MKFLVEFNSRYSTIAPPPPSEYRNLLSYSHRSFTAGGACGYLEMFESEEMWVLEAPDRVRLLTPMMQLVIEQLAKEGHEVACVDLRDPKTDPKLDTAFYALTRDTDRAVADAIKTYERAQIEVRGFEDMIAGAKLIRKLFPKAYILILVPTKSRARDICWQLAKASNFKVNLQPPSRMPVLSPCLVSTPKPFIFWRENNPDENLGLKKENWDIVLVPDPLGSCGEIPREALYRLCCSSCRIYSFLPMRATLSDRDRLFWQSICGGIRYRVPLPKVGTQMAWLRPPNSAVLARASPREWKQYAYYKNRRRNEFVASVARSFARGDISRLRKNGIPFRNNVAQTRGDNTPHVTVLVESSEHGKEMMALLEGWPLITLGAESPDPNELTAKGSIMTITCADRRGLRADVIVVASGSPAQLNLEKNWPRTDEFDDQDVLVVDFFDEADIKMRNAAQLRQKFGLRRGWTMADWSPANPGKLTCENAT
jgi:hypothetical protein